MITKKQRILLLLAAGYALALTGWTAGGTLLRPQRVRVECREVEPWENRLERQSPAERSRARSPWRIWRRTRRDERKRKGGKQ